MPTQVQRRQSEPIPITQKSMQQHQALRLALGSILTPKRPQVNTNSRPSSGAASPAVFFAGANSSSGSHTPIGSPPTHPTSIPTPASIGAPVSIAQGPNPSEHLHPYSYGHPGYTRSGHSHTHIPLPPSRLGPGRSSPSNSPTSSPPNSSHPSPSVNSTIILNPPPDIEPLSMPPPIILSHPHVHPHPHLHHLGIDPPPAPSESSFHHPGSHDPSPATPPTDGNSTTMMGLPPPGPPPPQPSPNDHSYENGSGHASGRGTPRAKFLEALQGKSAWDALIHGSFS